MRCLILVILIILTMFTSDISSTLPTTKSTSTLTGFVAEKQKVISNIHFFSCRQRAKSKPKTKKRTKRTQKINKPRMAKSEPPVRLNKLMGRRRFRCLKVFRFSEKSANCLVGYSEFPSIFFRCRTFSLKGLSEFFTLPGKTSS